MNIKVNLIIEKPIEYVWEVMGRQFGDAHLWSTNFISSVPEGKAKFAGLDYSIRNTITDRGNTIQELTAFNPEHYILSYEVTEGAPEIAKKAYATWSLEEKSVNLTILTMDFGLEPKMILPEEMELKIKMGIQVSATELAEELKHYLEKGVAHPNKMKQLNENN